MKITMNDGQELTVQDVELQSDGGLLVKTISATEEQLKKMFSDEMATKRISVSERGSQIGNYENYTQFNAIVKYTAGILGVVMYQDGQAPEDRIQTLEKEKEEMQKKIDQLEGCILEMSEKVYE